MKYGKINTTKGRLQSVEIYEGETIEQKVNRIVNNNEPITDGAPLYSQSVKMEYYRNTTYVRIGGILPLQQWIR